MISAAEAKVLYDDSGVEVDKYLQYKIEPEIKAAATQGARKVFHYLGSRDVFTHPRPDPLQLRIIEKLRELGYAVRWLDSEGDGYVPRGLADDEGKGPVHYNYGVQINW